MAFNFESEFVFIGKGDESFLENYSYELSDDPAGSGGKIYMALEVLNNQAEAEDIGEAIFANFKQKFYENAGADPYERFEEALKEANKTIETLKEEKVARFIGNLNVAIGAVVEDTLYISVTGDAEVYLVRKRFVSIVSEGLSEDSKNETFVNIANGTLEDGDRVLFSSSRLLRYITKGELGKIFSEISGVGKALAELQDFIMTEILGRSAVLGIAVAKEAEEGAREFENAPRAGFLGGILDKTADFLGKWLPKPKTPISEKLPWLAGLMSKLKSITLKPGFAKKITEKLPKIRMHRAWGREKILVAVIVLLIVLVGGTFWLRTRGDQKRAIAEQQAVLNSSHDLISEAQTTGQFDKAKASELLATAEQQAMQVLNSRYLRAEAVKTLDDIQKYRDGLDDVKKISSPTVLADMSEKRPTVSALGLMNLKDALYAFEYNALYEIILDRLQDPLTINDIETVILGAAFPDSESLLFLTRTGKMIEYKDSKFAFASTADGIWKKGVDMKTYNNRVYILDPERNQIWRYTSRRDGFDVGEAYSQNADLKKGVSLAIDATVYILNSDGTVIALYQGQKQDFPLKKMPLSPLASPTKIYTNADLNYLFILEPINKRVMLFKKDPKNGGAVYSTQYVFENVGNLRDLLVSDNRLYVMDDKKVYFVNLAGL